MGCPTELARSRNLPRVATTGPCAAGRAEVVRSGAVVVVPPAPPHPAISRMAILAAATPSPRPAVWRDLAKRCPRLWGDRRAGRHGSDGPGPSQGCARHNLGVDLPGTGVERGAGGREHFARVCGGGGVDHVAAAKHGLAY